MMHHLIKRTLIRRPVEEVFDFFSDASNLQRITPPFLHFSMLTPAPVRMEKGTIIDYRLKLFGFPFRWRTRISEWNPPYRFADEQLKGPYLHWYHEHVFEALENDTLMTDRISYQSPGGWLEFIPHRLFVKRNVEAIFRYRETCLSSIFKDPEPNVEK